MGLFNFFGKKQQAPEPAPAPAMNKLNSIFTMQFVIPFFQIFDKTNPKLANLPIRIATGGSIQYRIADPDLCFNNVCLGQMTPEQLAEHVKDGLTSVVKAFLNQITTIPVLQFEGAIMKINNAAKEYVMPIFQEEYGVNLRTFNISRITYDTNDPNYVQLQELSRQAVAQMAEKQESEHRTDLNRDRITRLRDNKQLDREDIALRRERNAIEIERKKMELELKSAEMHLDEDIHERRSSTDMAVRSGTLNTHRDDAFKINFDDDEFKIAGL